MNVLCSTSQGCREESAQDPVGKRLFESFLSYHTNNKSQRRALVRRQSERPGGRVRLATAFFASKPLDTRFTRIGASATPPKPPPLATSRGMGQDSSFVPETRPRGALAASGLAV
ncbi:hypothetical protein VDGL01_03459 [Verticillium dahliae]